MSSKSSLNNKRITALFISCLCFFISANLYAADTTQTFPAEYRWFIDGQKTTVRSVRANLEQEFLKEIQKNFVSEGFFNASVDSIVHLENAVEWHTSRSCRFEVARFDIHSDTHLEDVSPVFFRVGSLYSDAGLEQEALRLLQLVERAGYPLVTLEITELKPVHDACHVTISIEITAGEQMYAHSLRFEGLERTNESYLVRASGFRDSVLVAPAQMRRIQRNLQNTNYFRTVHEPDIIRKDGKYGLLFRVEENSINRFDAILGYVPQPNQPNTVVGTADLMVRNVGWQGSTLGIRFERMQQLTTKFALEYDISWLGGWPVGVGGSFDFIQQDTTYQIRNVKIQSSYYLNSTTDLLVGVRREVTLANQNPNVATTVLDGQALFGGIGIRFNNTDRRISPTQGYRFTAFFETGSRTFTDERAVIFGVQEVALQQELRLEAHYFLPLHRRQVLAFRTQAYVMQTPNFTESDLTRFGGARTFRGFREDQFRASRLMWGDLEYRYLLDPVSYAFVFGAYGGYHRPTLVTELTNANKITRYLYSYGFGFSYNTPIGFVQFTYALSDEDVFSNGKIHFGIISEF